MGNRLPIAIFFCMVVASGLTSCGKKPDANNELERAAKSLDMPPTPPPAAAQPAPSAQPQAPAQLPQQPAPAPAQQMSQAMASYKSGNYEDAVTRLYKLRAQTAMTPQQLIAVQNAMGAVMSEIGALAAKGDARAKLAVKQYEEMQNKQVK